MKKTFLNCALALALCVSMSGGAVMAEETDKDIMLISADTAVEPAVLMPVQVNGAVTVLEDGALYIKNDNEESIHSEVIARISEETAVVDAETGFAMNPADIADGAGADQRLHPVCQGGFHSGKGAGLIHHIVKAHHGLKSFYHPHHHVGTLFSNLSFGKDIQS